jgi:hypothetical protein
MVDWMGLKVFEEVFACRGFVFCNAPKNAVEGADFQALVSWHGNALMRGILRFKDDVAAGLVHLDVAPLFAKCSGKLFAAKVARKFHPSAMTSSRTMRKWMASGFGRSKQNPCTASLTCSRSSCHVSPWVKMASVRHSAEKPPSASCVTSKINSFMDRNIYA